MRKNTRLRTTIFFIFLFFMTGCGAWRNFTAYFNLYFNTTQAYDAALADIEELRENIFELKEPRVTKDIDKNLDKVVEKGSKILQYESESSYVDDALFMTGVAFYYKGQYAKAIRKFQELAAQNAEDYQYKNKLWMAKGYLQLREFEKGSSMLEELKNEAIAAEKDDILKETYRTLVAYHINRDNIAAAINEASEMLNAIDDDELKAQIAYQVGMLYLNEEQTEESITAFESVLDYSPDFETEFKSKFEIAKLKKEVGEREESYKMLQELYNEGKYKEYWGDVYFEMGLMQFEDGNSEKAFEMFSEVDSVYTGTEGAGRSQLMLGEILKNEYADYDSALLYYDKVAKSKASAEIKEEAKDYSNSIRSYSLMKKDIRTTERQIQYLEEPNIFVRDSLAYLRFLDRKRNGNDEAQIPATRDNERYDPTIDNDALEEDERRADTTDAVNKADTVAVNDTLGTSLISGSFDLDDDEDYIVEERPIRPRVSLDSLRSQQQTAYFRLGNLFFVDYQRPDSAYFYYSKILESFDNVSNKPRILFALGAYYESTGEQEKADSLYNLIYTDYKTYQIANEAALKLGQPPLIIEEDPAKTLFLEAEEEIDKSNTDSAFVLLTQVEENYPESIYAPKSIYTKGWLYENVMDQPDSAISMYSKLLDNFKNSLYASNVQGKVEAYNVMLEAKAVEDSVAAEAQDSTKASEPSMIQGSIPDSSGIVNESNKENIDTLQTSVLDSIKTNEKELPTEPVPIDTTKGESKPVIKRDLQPKKIIEKDTLKVEKKTLESDFNILPDSTNTKDSTKAQRK